MIQNLGKNLPGRFEQSIDFSGKKEYSILEVKNIFHREGVVLMCYQQSQLFITW